MNRKSKISQRFKYLMAAFIILFSQIVPLYQLDAEANTANSKWLNFKFDEFSRDAFNQLFTVSGDAEVADGTNFIRLTPNSALKSGAVFNNTHYVPDTIIHSVQPFHLE